MWSVPNSENFYILSIQKGQFRPKKHLTLLSLSRASEEGYLLDLKITLVITDCREASKIFVVDFLQEQNRSLKGTQE
jgi:hypothetical protein